MNHLILRKNGLSEETLQTLDLAAVAKKTEGYTPQDLVLLLERAVHASIVQRGESEHGNKDWFLTSLKLQKNKIPFLFPFIICLCSVSLRCQVSVMERFCGGTQWVHSSLTLGCRPSHPKWIWAGAGGGTEGGTTAANGHHSAPC